MKFGLKGVQACVAIIKFISSLLSKASKNKMPNVIHNVHVCATVFFLQTLDVRMMKYIFQQPTHVTE